MEVRKIQNEAILNERKFKVETMLCNKIGQRISLQEHLMKRGDEILKTCDEFLANEEESKEKLSKDFVVSELFDNWLDGFTVYQPTDYFLDADGHQCTELLYSVETDLDFMLSTLQIFGLPKDYINGYGHHAMWSKEKGGDDKKKGKGKKKKAKPTGAAAKLAKSIGVKTAEVEVRPTFFDLFPF